MKGRIGETLFWRTNKEHLLGCDPNMWPGEFGDAFGIVMKF